MDVNIEQFFDFLSSKKHVCHISNRVRHLSTPYHKKQGKMCSSDSGLPRPHNCCVNFIVRKLGRACRISFINFSTNFYRGNRSFPVSRFLDNLFPSTTFICKINLTAIERDGEFTWYQNLHRIERSALAVEKAVHQKSSFSSINQWTRAWLPVHNR